jgi:hypothetical protein
LQEEEEALRWLLVEEETEKRRREADRKQKEQVEKSRQDMLRANEEQRRIRERISKEEAAKEAALIQQFLEKCAEDDRKEQALRQVKAEARIRYIAEIAASRDEKMALYQRQKLEELEALEAARRKDELRKRIVREARRKLLEEHAAVLRGFLPRGVILSSDDLDILKAFDRDGDGRLDADEMDLAQAAFAAFDPSQTGRKPNGGAAQAQQQQEQQQQQQQQQQQRRPAGGFNPSSSSFPLGGGGGGGNDLDRFGGRGLTTASTAMNASASSSRSNSTAGLLPGGGAFLGERKR